MQENKSEFFYLNTVYRGGLPERTEAHHSWPCTHCYLQ